ncbi:DUF5693 family protein [Bacillus taeanensis]|uniref:Uncharacterized protein n=1 Tax=Bacillus taeanensis TaxID=273032 RepID=A0A366XR44_9BACI|nr:DUF5693 family protein [Bacillus taeanensis]RBW67595.1 hypothetical protein DS031_21230 [Bacillus taeanensis]
MKKSLIVLLLISFVLTVPLISERVKTEWQNNTYEITVPYEEAEALMNEGLNKDNVFTSLKEAGVQSLSLTPETLWTLQEKGVLLLSSKKDIRMFFALTGENIDPNSFPEEEGVFFQVVDEQHPLLENVYKIFGEQLTEIQTKQTTLYFVEEGEGSIINKPLGFDPTSLNTIKDYGFMLVARISNDIDSSNQFIVEEEMLNFPPFANKILFTGEEVLGFDSEKLRDMREVIQNAEKFKNSGYSFLMIEFANQKGDLSFAHTMDENIIRLFSTDADNSSSNQEKLIRAVKERNIRNLYIHIYDMQSSIGDLDEAKGILKDSSTFISNVKNEMPSTFHLGNAEPFAAMKDYSWARIAAIVGVIAFIGLATQALMPKLALPAVLLLSMAAAGLYIVSFSLLMKGFALAVSLTAAVYAVLSARNIQQKWSSLFLHYIKAAGIALLGAWFISALLYGNDFLVKIDEFRGVKLLYVLPIVVTALYVVIPFFKADQIETLVLALYRKTVKYGHLFLIGLIGVVLYYYVSRSGNDAVVSGLELQIRQTLENILYVRPRTKEFLIGFPLFVVALYVSAKTKNGRLLFIPSVIGFLSLVNTFTHLHIPLYVSLLRSFYSLFFGFIIGAVLIVLYKRLSKYAEKAIVRWKE